MFLLLLSLAIRPLIITIPPTFLKGAFNKYEEIFARG
jgi:hypothetical protein